MSHNVPISSSNITAPTPQNTPLTHAPISLGLSRPTVPDISEDNEQDDAEGTEPELSGFQQQMLGMVHGKLADLVGKSSGYIESLPIEVKLSVEALKGVQVKQNDLQNKYKRECLELEKKVRNDCYRVSTPYLYHIIRIVPSATNAFVRAQACDHQWRS
jgi:nucleosome assembly protein 1-like 1